MNNVWKYISAIGAILVAILATLRSERKTGAELERSRQKEVDWTESKRVEEAVDRADDRISDLTDDGVRERIKELNGYRDDDKSA